MKKLVESLGPPIGGHSWFVSFDFSRLVNWSVAKLTLRKMLEDFKLNPTDSPFVCQITETLQIEIHRASKRLETFFVIGAHTDEQSGGFVVSEVIRNLKFCIAEKANKIATLKSKYPEWWLVLADQIGYGLLDASEISYIQNSMRESIQDWNKIIIVNPLNYRRSYEL